MRSLKLQIVVQLGLLYASLALLHGVRRLFAFYYHRALAQMGSALPAPTESVGIPLLGGGFYCPQPHTFLFYFCWGAMAAAPLAVAFLAVREVHEDVRFRLWHGWMTVYYLAVVTLLLAEVACLALPFLPIHSVVG